MSDWNSLKSIKHLFLSDGRRLFAALFLMKLSGQLQVLKHVFVMAKDFWIFDWRLFFIYGAADHLSDVFERSI